MISSNTTLLLLLLILSGSLLVCKSPVIQVSSSSTQVGQIAIEAQQGNNIGSRFGRAPSDKEERHPGEVEAKLDGVDCHAMPGCLDDLW
ncbi:hypothetical protein Trco_002063 [Trichoderma cornu-damae]|uniref:Uncharacterized protein n=1 Tax=Trichoderma cornu-damae TaxID=654480 RepID=A0A9P8QU67_9HYPO|nr:hypothetical protein Trco_002063 [Trichoderma cornu-damae]